MTRKKITLHPYNANWPKQAEVEMADIRKILGSHCLAIHHIGSTSIPGLTAKEDLDVLCIVDDLKSSLVLAENGFVYKGELNIPLRYFFSKNSESSKVNLHVVETDHGFIGLNLAFRDYLRTHDDARDAYGALKAEIVKDESSGDRIQNLMPKYTYEKSDFIQDILIKAGFDDYTYNFCFHKSEWEAYQRILGKIKKDEPFKSLTSAFGGSKEYHLVLKKGTKVVAAALLEVVDGSPVLREIAAEKKSHEERLHAIIDRWAANLS